jgi:hypothetical protein
MEELRMKLRCAVIAVLCIGLVCGVSLLGTQAYAQGTKVVMPKITVLSPMGTPPSIEAKPMAPRLNTLDGKTIYLVNTGYIGTDRVMDEMSKWFQANYPKTTVVIKRSSGGMSGVDKALWAEIGEKGDAAIVGLGH